MKILLMDIDSKIPNLALKKIEKYHLDRGDEVMWNNELFQHSVDKTYVSIVFDWNKDKGKEFPNAEIGGSGWDLCKTLPKEIEEVKPRINWGFTTRGCIRNCEFCIVPRKEGKINVTGDIYDIWDRKAKKLIIMDNNILALPQHFKKICSQLRKEKLKVDFNQGLDVRLLNDDLVEELKTIRHERYKFAWDNKEDLTDKLKWLYKQLGCCTIFVLCGFKLTFEEALERFHIIKDIGHNGYAMRYRPIYNEKRYKYLAEWVNQRHIFHSYSWKDFCINRPKRRK